ncbi:MAG: NnrU family protein [Rhizobiales bacterium]|nr:NnrU family protein [Hyphomicrobiales bacterium]
MLVLILGLVVFLGMHSIAILAPSARKQWIERRGAAAWKIPYTLISLVGFALIVWGYGLARADAPLVYEPPLWGRHLAATLMLFALIFFFASYIRGRISRFLKHPQLVAVMIWSVAHLLSNGDLASLVLFGAFLVWAAVDRVSVSRRVAAGLASDNPGGPLRNDFILIGFGLVVYAVFVLWLHRYLFGVAPLG